MVKNSQEKNHKAKAAKKVAPTPTEEVVEQKQPKAPKEKKEQEKTPVVEKQAIKTENKSTNAEGQNKKNKKEGHKQATTTPVVAVKSEKSVKETPKASKSTLQDEKKESMLSKKRAQRAAACAKAESKLEENESIHDSDSEGSVEDHFFAGNDGEGVNTKAFANPEDEDKSEGVYMKEELLQRVEQIQSAFRRRLKVEKKQKIPWNEHLSLVSDERIVITENTEISADIQREVQFYKTTLVNAQLALKYLQEEGVPTKRPDDYFAEMFKSDKIMGKIRTKLVMEQESIKSFEEKKQKQESRKLQRILRAKSDQKKSREKRDNLKAIDKWKEEIKVKGDKAKDLSEFMLKPSANNRKPHPVQKAIGKEKTSDRPGLRPSTSNKLGTDLRGKGERSYKGGAGNKFGGKKFGDRSNSKGGSFGDRSQSRGPGGKSFSGKGSSFGGDKGGKQFGAPRGPKPISKSFGGKKPFSNGGDRGGKSFAGKGGDSRGGRSFGGGRGGDSRGGKSFGGDSRGGKSFGGDSRGGKSFGGDSRGGKSFGGGASRGGKSFGGGASRGGKSFGGGASRGGKSFGSSSSSRGGRGGRGGGRGGRR